MRNDKSQIVPNDHKKDRIPNNVALKLSCFSFNLVLNTIPQILFLSLVDEIEGSKSIFGQK